MPVELATPGALHLISRAALIDDDDTKTFRAWVERVVRKDPDIRWIVGNYVEANNANDNGHIFPLDDLRTAHTTIAGKPLNMLHRDHYIVGAFAGAELQEPDELNPYVEAVAGMWHTRFPEEYFNIQRAHDEGNLFFSMEAVPAEVSCPTCTHRVVFAGADSETYCDHMRGPTGPKVLHNPIFAGGAIIIPPVRPGWSRADIKTISQLVDEQPDVAERLYAGVSEMSPHLSVAEWESVMGELMIIARSFSTKEREEMAKNGMAMPDGSYPIKTEQDVRNAIQAIGRAPASKRGRVRAHIKKRAKALGCMELIPEDW